MHSTIPGSDERTSKAERLFKKYRSVMFSAAISVLNDTYLADDAVSQAFIRVLKHIDKIEEEDAERTASYMAMVCKNIAINMSKRNMYLNINEDTVERMEDTINSYNIDPSKIVQDKESFNVLIDYINSLEPRYKEVMILKYYHDMQNKEIARALNVNESTVRKRVIKGREKLFRLLKRSGEYEIE